MGMGEGMTAIYGGEPRDGTTSREVFERARALFDAGDPTAALGWLERAYACDANDARVRSWYGLCVGLVERRFEEAVELCQSAAKQEFFNPDLYLNLARLYLGFGFKAEGVRYLRRGLMIDPGHAEILQMLRDLGDRAAPVLGFLPRRHPVNRWLGAVRHVIATHKPMRWAV
jgi:tetratricopeptide (TPR) repeat protein